MIWIIGIACLTVGIGIGGASVMRKVKSGRIVISDRIYLCKDTGPVVRS